MTLEVFPREKIGVDDDTLADSFLMGVLGGRLRNNVVHFRSVADAAKALRKGTVAAVLAPRWELEAALPGEQRLIIDEAKIDQLKTGRWPLGMAVKADAVGLAAALTRAQTDEAGWNGGGNLQAPRRDPAGGVREPTAERAICPRGGVDFAHSLRRTER